LAHDAVPQGGGLQDSLEKCVLGLERRGLAPHEQGQLQHLPGQGGQQLEQGQIVGQTAVAAADAVAGQHAHAAAVNVHGYSQEGYGFSGQLRAHHRALQEPGLMVDVLHDHGMASGQHRAGDAFTGGVHAALHFGAREAVGIADSGRALRVECAFAQTPMVVAEHQPPAVQAQQLAHQVQHLAHHRLGCQAASHKTQHLGQQQPFLFVPGLDGVVRHRRRRWRRLFA